MPFSYQLNRKWYLLVFKIFVMKNKCVYDILSLNHCNDKSNCTISRRIQRNLNKMQISQSEEANIRMWILNSKLLLYSHSSISFDFEDIPTYFDGKCQILSSWRDTYYKTHKNYFYEVRTLQHCDVRCAGSNW